MLDKTMGVSIKYRQQSSGYTWKEMNLSDYLPVLSIKERKEVLTMDELKQMKNSMRSYVEAQSVLKVLQPIAPILLLIQPIIWILLDIISISLLSQLSAVWYLFFIVGAFICFAESQDGLLGLAFGLKALDYLIGLIRYASLSRFLYFIIYGCLTFLFLRNFFQTEKGKKLAGDMTGAAATAVDSVKNVASNVKSAAYATCPGCGASVARGTAFCPKCGTKMTFEPETPNVTPVDPNPVPVNEPVVPEPEDVPVPEPVDVPEEPADIPETPAAPEVPETPVFPETQVFPETPAAPVRYCMNCGAKLDADTVFCPECGARAEEPEAAPEEPPVRYCMNCGAKLDPDTVFCPECGTKAE